MSTDQNCKPVDPMKLTLFEPIAVARKVVRGRLKDGVAGKGNFVGNAATAMEDNVVVAVGDAIGVRRIGIAGVTTPTRRGGEQAVVDVPNRGCWPKRLVQAGLRRGTQSPKREVGGRVSLEG